MRTLRVARIALVAVASALIGCAGSGGGSGGGGGGVKCKPPATPTVLLSSNIQPIFNVSCALAGCHSGAVPVQGLDLSTGKTFSNTVNVKSTEIPSRTRIMPGKPDGADSYLVQKIEAMPPGYAGAQMPQGCPGAPLGGAQCLTADSITAIRQWIMECAQNN
jgi:hypothetical protein